MAAVPFPNEIWWLLLSHLDVRSICRGRRSFRLWYHLTKNDSFWKQYAIQHRLEIRFKPSCFDHEWFCRAHLVSWKELPDGCGVGRCLRICGELGKEKDRVGICLVYRDPADRIPKYVGQIRCGVPHGQCQMFSQRGDLEFTGLFVKGERTYGERHYPECAKDRYLGEMENGVRHGHGSYWWEIGDQFSGKWSNGKMCGHGTYHWADGRTYSGPWVNHNQQGPNGVFTWPDGSIYRGDWRAGKREGRGMMTWPDPPFYWEGEWVNDLRKDCALDRDLWDGFFALDFSTQRVIAARVGEKRKMSQQ